jgi:N-acetylglutamate synthase-like GNAT family acetyltransferase
LAHTLLIFARMNAADYRVRRATVEDLPALLALWKSMNFASGELERRLTEFQVAVDAAETIVGAVGFQIAGKNGLVHSEAFTDFGLADALRPKLWERLQMVAANHGTVRAWTRETAPFWSQIGLTTPDTEALGKMPPAWKDQPGEWRMLKLREDVEEVLSADKEFEMFKQATKAEAHATLGTAKLMNKVALALAILLGLGVFFAVIYLSRGNISGLLNR